MGEDLKEIPCYGIDFCTHSNILIALNADENDEKFNGDVRQFIEKKLLKAIHHPDNVFCPKLFSFYKMSLG